MPLEVGQKLWFVPANRPKFNTPFEITITKIGRKWASTSYRDLRLNIETLDADGGEYNSPGQAYLSQKEYDDYVALKVSWVAFVGSLETYEAPPGMTIEKIEKMMGLIQNRE